MFLILREHQNQNAFAGKKFGPEIWGSKGSIFFDNFSHDLSHLASIKREYLRSGLSHGARLGLILLARDRASIEAIYLICRGLFGRRIGPNVVKLDCCHLNRNVSLNRRDSKFQI